MVEEAEKLFVSVQMINAQVLMQSLEVPGGAGTMINAQVLMPPALYVVPSNRQSSCQPSQFPHPAQPFCPGRLPLPIPALFLPISLQPMTAPGLLLDPFTGTQIVVLSG